MTRRDAPDVVGGVARAMHWTEAMSPIPEPWVIEYVRRRTERIAERSRGRLELPVAPPAEERRERPRPREVVIEIGRADE